ncbi:MAG: YdiU family protein [Gammaproteobacteria bacterium]|nr:YdiU family protein [Gammaproteobacteria bacterium]
MDAAVRQLSRLRFRNTFAALPEGFHARVTPTPLRGTHLASVSPAAAGLLGLGDQALADPELLDWLSGRRPHADAASLAMCYAGHQFGHYVPQLGDGRAIVLGEVDGADGGHWELQLKGAGLTPFSRDGDGRAVLRSSIREYLCSEAMHALGIPTTRALCLFGSDETVYRERVERGALLLRMAPSHVRFGSFEVFFYRQQFQQLRELADYVIDHDFPALRDDPRPYLALLREVVQRTAALIAQWQLVGFAHGVMNTDNMSILGLTLDYGPFGFLDAYEPGFVCNHSDHHGRYAFDRQPSIGLWNLTCLAQAMLPLLDADDGDAAVEQATDALAAYEPTLVAAYAAGLRAKLGLRDAHVDDQALGADLLALMAAGRVDYTNLFRDLAAVASAAAAPPAALRDRFVDRAGFDAWLVRYRERLRRDGVADAERAAAMRRVNPRYVLRNYLAQQAIAQAEQGDYAELDRLLALLARPYDEQPGMQAYAAEPPDWGRALEISCSS